jgi:hypothetical protein
VGLLPRPRDGGLLPDRAGRNHGNGREGCGGRGLISWIDSGSACLEYRARAVACPDWSRSGAADVGALADHRVDDALVAELGERLLGGDVRDAVLLAERFNAR